MRGVRDIGLARLMWEQDGMPRVTTAIATIRAIGTDKQSSNPSPGCYWRPGLVAFWLKKFSLEVFVPTASNVQQASKFSICSNVVQERISRKIWIGKESVLDAALKDTQG
jgi:hypothetical protein